MLTNEVKGGGESATRVADALRLFALAPSLGGTEGLVTPPGMTTDHGFAREERSRRGISDAMLRLSVGLEDAGDLIAHLQQALGGSMEAGLGVFDRGPPPGFDNGRGRFRWRGGYTAVRPRPAGAPGGGAGVPDVAGAPEVVS